MKRHRIPTLQLSFSLLCAGAVSLFVAVSCKKQQIKKETSSEKIAIATAKAETLIQGAHEVFESTLKTLNMQAPNEVVKAITTSDRTQHGKKTAQSHPSTENRLNQIADIIDWDKAVVKTYQNNLYLTIPFKESMTPFEDKAYEFVRAIIYRNDTISGPKLSIVEILGKKGMSLGKDATQLIDQVSNFKYYQAEIVLPDVSADVIFFSETYTRESSFEILKGKVIEKRISFRSDKKIRQ